ncbi:hypothetical protein QQX98_003958 [Neonectria punicea]|uniref:HNH nuclease domain-containing protein n=1 Tax=Neonectria punicea TaxID=979145 RepID=A0ABR1HBL1_9HYPO
MAILPSALAIARSKHDRARYVSTELRKTFEARKREVEPDVEPDEELPEPDPLASLELASLGVELASKEKEAIRLEREVVAKEQNAGILHATRAEELLQDLRKRYFSAGDDLWRHQKKKMRLGDPGTVRLLEPRGNGLSECLLSLYKKHDGQDKKKKRPSNWRIDALSYYKGSGNDHPGLDGTSVWCHISGMWHATKYIKAAHIVPFFLDSGSISEMLFGSRAESLERAGNSLLLSDVIKGWFDSYHLVIVPVDATETPITRWRTDVISPDIRNSRFDSGDNGLGRDLHGKELVFHNAKRPVSRFLYFHFIMALIRIKDLKRSGWQGIWARYYEQRPFPTPGNYMRQSMLFALATHFGTVDMQVVDSWIVGHGFDSPLKLTDDEATEAARRVLVAVEAATSRAETQDSLEEDNPEDWDSG